MTSIFKPILRSPLRPPLRSIIGPSGASKPAGGGYVTGAATSGSAAAASHSIATPAVAAGDLLLMVVGARRTLGVAISAPAGWTEVYNPGSKGSPIAVFVKVAQADAIAGSVSVAFSEAATCAAIVYCVSAAANPGAVEVATASGSGGSVSFTALSPSWGATADTLAFAAFTGASPATILAWPYAGGRKHAASPGTGGTHCETAACHAVVAGASVSPGACEKASSGVWSSVAIGVRIG